MPAVARRERPMPDPLLSDNELSELSKLSAGFAGASAALAREQWADESRHLLTGPGAYEWWYFHAMSPAGDGLLLSLFEGLPFHPRYLTQINRYTQRMAPIQKPWPALQASRYPAAYMAVYRGGKRVAQFLNLYPADSTISTPGDIRIGPNRITIRRDGSIGIVCRGYPYRIVRGQPRKRRDRVLSATLDFKPTFSGIQHTRPFRAPDKTGADHHWVLAAPHGKMSGEALLLDTQEEKAEFELEIDSLGYHDHVYGQGGLATGVKTLLWGFIQGETWTAAWHQTVTGKTGHRQADGLVLFELDKSPVIIDAPESRLTRHQRSNWLLKHPGHVEINGSDAHGHAVELVVDHKETLDAAPFHSRLDASGTISIPGRGTLTGRGSTHVLRLQRLKWPVLSDLMLLAITPIPRDDPIWSV